MMSMHVAILAGGKSSRLGQDKAITPVAGVPMIERVMAAVRPLNVPITVVGRPAWPNCPSNVAFVADAFPAHQGPMAGIVSALLAQPERDVMVLACDMPLLTPEVVRQLFEAHVAGRPQHVATLSVTVGDRMYAEPLFSVYRPAILAVLQDAMSTGQRSLQPLLQRSDVTLWKIPADVQRTLMSVDTPEALAAAERALA